MPVDSADSAGKSPTFVKDQNGVVFCDLGCMSEEFYREIQGKLPDMFPAYEELPFWDSRQQSFIDVEDPQVSGNSE